MTGRLQKEILAILKEHGPLTWDEVLRSFNDLSPDDRNARRIALRALLSRGIVIERKGLCLRNPQYLRQD